MGDAWEGLLLVEEYWPLTTGAQPVRKPSQSTWFGIVIVGSRADCHRREPLTCDGTDCRDADRLTNLSESSW